MKRFWILLVCLWAMLVLPMKADAAETAEDITDLVTKSDQRGFSKAKVIYDKNQLSTANIADGSYLTLEYEEGIGSLYLIFDLEYDGYTVINNDTGEVSSWGEHGFLHEFVDLKETFGAAPKSVTIRFENGRAMLNELYVFSQGENPDFVQKWEVPAEGKTDLVLFSTHGDDEQLFFAGVLPYYAGELQYEVQVVYLTNHRNHTMDRCHEMLNGLWAVGVRNYPVFGNYGDYLTGTAEKAMAIYNRKKITEEELVGFVVEQLRRFQPMVAVGHDLIHGEYGHGMHILYAQLLTKALEISNDPEQYPESAEEYGVWDVPKTYLHLWPENEIRMNWDRPLRNFGGQTAFQVTKYRGFPCHESQYNDFAWYILPFATAAAVEKYNPCEYGLYRSTVGEDVQKQDFFENVKTHAMQELEALSAEEEARLEAVREAVQQGQQRVPQKTSQPVKPLPAVEKAEEDPGPIWKIDKMTMISVIIIGFSLLTMGEIITIRRKEK